MFPNSNCWAKGHQWCSCNCNKPIIYFIIFSAFPSDLVFCPILYFTVNTFISKTVFQGVDQLAFTLATRRHFFTSFEVCFKGSMTFWNTNQWWSSLALITWVVFDGLSFFLLHSSFHPHKFSNFPANLWIMFLSPDFVNLASICF